VAFYLVTATPRAELMGELHARLARDEFLSLRPFGGSLTSSLRNARLRPNGTAVWEEEDYCTPPLAQERAAVLDRYFDGLHVEAVDAGEGWRHITNLSPLFPGLQDPTG
jgi:hypothetical protein